MAVPKKRHSTQRKGKRRAAIKLAPATLTTCSHCQQLLPPHTVCPNCGYYKGEEVLKKKSKVKTPKSKLNVR